MDIKEELGLPEGHRMTDCDEHEVCRRYNQGLAEWTERLKAENEAYRNSEKITAEDLAITIFPVE